MDFLNEYVVAVVMAACYCVGYVIKNFMPTDNKFIPLIMLLLGAFFNVWFNNWEITLPILLGGMASGLASTGVNQLVKQLTKVEAIEK